MEVIQKDSKLTDQNTDEYIQMISEKGFEKVLEIPFSFTDYKSERTNEIFFVFFSPNDGMVIVFETYHNGSVMSGGKIYFSHKISDPLSPNNWAHGSNSPDKANGVTVGNNDARHKICRLIDELRCCYSLMPKWISQGSFGIWFLHHGDTENKNYDYKAINSARWEMLPEKVKLAIPKN